MNDSLLADANRIDQIKPDDDLGDPGEAEKKQVEKFSRMINQVLSDNKTRFARLKKNRELVEGKIDGDTARANFLYSQIKQDQRRVYARNPEISVRPQEQVEPSSYPVLRKLSKTCEILLNRQLHDGGLKETGKSLVWASKTVNIAWAKVVFQEDFETDPVIQGRPADSQDNLARIRSLIDDIEKGDLSEDEISVKKMELKQQVTSIEQQAEVAVNRGWSIKKVKTENIIFDFGTIGDFSNYPNTGWMAEFIEMSRQEVKDKFGFLPKVGVTETSKAMSEANKEDGEEKKSGGEKIRVVELWNKDTQTIYTFILSGDRYLREPYSPDNTGERFYPYFGMQFDPFDDSFWGTSTAELNEELLKDKDKVRKKFSQARDRTIPHIVVKTGSFTPEDLKSLQNPDNTEIVEVEGDDDLPLKDNLIVTGMNAQIDPILGNTLDIDQDWERINQTGDAQGGFVQKVKTATEASNIKEGVAERSSGDNDTIEDLIAEIARFMLQINFQVMSLEEVEKIVGEGATWPRLTKDEIFNHVLVGVRAGSSGKPNKFQEQEKWIKFSPIIAETVQKADEMEKSGNKRMSQFLMNIVEEFLKRLDERLSLEEFLPEQEDDVVDEQALQEQQLLQEQKEQQAQEFEMRLEKMSAEIQKLKSESLKNITQSRELDSRIGNFFNTDAAPQLPANQFIN